MNNKFVRGIPFSDYQLLRSRVIAGELTWDEAVDQGLCLKAHEKPRKRKAVQPRFRPTFPKRNRTQSESTN